MERYNTVQFGSCVIRDRNRRWVEKAVVARFLTRRDGHFVMIVTLDKCLCPPTGKIGLG